MKNIFKSLLLVVICITLSGCLFNKYKKVEVVNGAVNKVDYGMYDYFVGIDWVRENKGIKEELKFYSDGRIRYADSNGNPINNADVCTNFYYNESTKTIGLTCHENASGAVKDIVIKDYTKNTLTLDFNGDIRIFTKE